MPIISEDWRGQLHMWTRGKYKVCGRGLFDIPHGKSVTLPNTKDIKQFATEFDLSIKAILKIEKTIFTF
jgi:hypothetical protein